MRGVSALLTMFVIALALSLAVVFSFNKRVDRIKARLSACEKANALADEQED